MVGGAFVRQVMWEGIVTDPAIGWTAQSVDHEPLRFVCLRSEGASECVGLAAQAHHLRAHLGQHCGLRKPLSVDVMVSV
jgi:biofilm PGA synthesis N-glycosyltransferase PgaC